MYGCESWTIKKAEGRRIDAFKLWCWRRLLRVPWTARRSNQSILKEINSEHSLEGLMLKLQYLGHLLQRSDSLEKILMLEKIEGRRRGWQSEMIGCHHWLNEHKFEQTPGYSGGQRSLAWCIPRGCRIGHDLRLNNKNTHMCIDQIKVNVKETSHLSAPFVFVFVFSLIAIRQTFPSTTGNHIIA